MATSPSDREPIGNTRIAGGVILLAVCPMAWDHLWGNVRGSDDPFPVDPVAFFVAFVLIVVAGLVVFGVTVPRSGSGLDRCG